MPNGSIYGLFIYDSDLNILGSFSSADSERRVWKLPTNTTLYIQLRVLSGNGSTQPYELSVLPTPNFVRLHPNGQAVGLDSRTGTLTVDGRSFNLHTGVRNWSPRHVILGHNTHSTRSQAIIPFIGNTPMRFQEITWMGSYRGIGANGGGAINISVPNAIEIEIVDFTLFNFRQGNHPSSSSGHLQVRFPRFIIVDIDTGRAVDYDNSFLYNPPFAHFRNNRHFTPAR